MNKYQVELKKNKGRGKDFAARYLASIGSEFNEKINEQTDKFVSANKDCPIFYLAIADSLIWVDYAVRKTEFY